MQKNSVFRCFVCTQFCGFYAKNQPKFTPHDRSLDPPLLTAPKIFPVGLNGGPTRKCPGPPHAPVVEKSWLRHCFRPYFQKWEGGHRPHLPALGSYAYGGDQQWHVRFIFMTYTMPNLVHCYMSNIQRFLDRVFFCTTITKVRHNLKWTDETEKNFLKLTQDFVISK